jgi:hypothetical protein
MHNGDDASTVWAEEHGRRLHVVWPDLGLAGTCRVAQLGPAEEGAIGRRGRGDNARMVADWVFPNWWVKLQGCPESSPAGHYGKRAFVGSVDEATLVLLPKIL